MKVLCVDPSVRSLGWASFVETPCGSGMKLTGSGSIQARKASLDRRGEEAFVPWLGAVDWMTEAVEEVFLAEGADICVIEWPEVQASSAGKAALNTGGAFVLMSIAVSIRCMLAWNGVEVLAVPVRRWKGQTPKRVTVQRIKKHWGFVAQDSDEADAVGIGDWYCRKHRGMSPIV